MQYGQGINSSQSKPYYSLWSRAAMGTLYGMYIIYPDQIAFCNAVSKEYKHFNTQLACGNLNNCFIMLKLGISFA